MVKTVTRVLLRLKIPNSKSQVPIGKVWGLNFGFGVWDLAGREQPVLRTDRASHAKRQPSRQLMGAPIADDLSMTVKYVVGSLLVVIGLVSLLLGGFRWTQQKTVVDIGPIEATTEEHKTLPIPPVVGALALIGGIVVLVVPTKRRT